MGLFFAKIKKFEESVLPDFCTSGNCIICQVLKIVSELNFNTQANRTLKKIYMSYLPGCFIKIRFSNFLLIQFSVPASVGLTTIAGDSRVLKPALAL